MTIKHYYAYPKSIHGRFGAMQLTIGVDFVEFFNELTLVTKYTVVPNGVVILDNNIPVEFNYGDWILIYNDDFLILENEDFTRMFRTEELPNV